MADDLSLLFRLRAENSQAKAVVADTRQAVTALRNSFGSDLKQMQGVARSALSEIGENVNAFVGQRIPLIGGAFLRVTSNLKGLNDELRRGGPQTAALSQQIDSIAKSSGKSTTEVARFLTTFTRLEGQAARNDAAFKFFGGSVDLIGNKTARFLPQLEAAGSELAQVSTAATATGSAMAGMAGPIGIAVAALAAEIVVVVTLTKEVYALAKASAEYQGKLFDLSQQTGVSVETLSALDIAIRKVGGSTEGAAQPLIIFQTKLEEAQDSSSNAGKAFRLLGVDALDTETALRQALTALAAMPEGFEQTARARELFGRGGRFFLALLKETGGDIDEVTRRFKGLGGVTTEQAALADEFNDKLIDLEVQLRGIGTKAIPVVLDAIKDLSKTLEENRDLFRVLQGMAQAVAITIFGPLRAALLTAKVTFEAVQPALQITVALLQKMKEAIEFIAGHPITLPNLTGSAPTLTPATPATNPDDRTASVRKGIQDEIEARKSLLGVLSFDYAQRQKQAEANIALAQREFEAGKRTRQQLLDATIEGTRKQTKAEIDELEAKRAIKVREAALVKSDAQKQREFSDEALAIDTQIANKRADQARKEADERAKVRLAEQKSEQSHLEAKLDTLTRLGNERIEIINEQIRLEIIDRQAGLDEIEKIENAALQARGQLLKRELEFAGIGPDRQVVLDKIKALQVDRTTLERQQSERRRQITREEFEEKRQIVLTNLDALLQIEQIRGNAQIATVQAQAALRIKTEEQAAKEILAIRLRLLDSEIEATEAKQKAAAGIADPKERRQAQTQIANDLKILNAQRVAIQDEGNREIDSGRRRDIENERRYADELEDIKERIRRTEREAAGEVIRLMQIHFASRKDLIRARLQQDLADENSRHRQAEETIRNLEQENRESNRTEQEKLEAEHEINLLREAELRRHTLEEKAITDEAKKDEVLASPFGGLVEGLASGQLTELRNGVQEFADVARVAFSAVGAVVNQLASGIGNLVQNFVLLGSNGPNAFRKLVASVLAGVAAQAATLAIMELAYGIAALTPWGAAVYGPAPFHFKSAALFGSIATVAGFAGRGVAGGLFQTQGAGGGDRDSTGSQAPQPLNTIAGRNQALQQQQTIKTVVHMDIKTDGGQIVKTWVEDYNNGGVTREVIGTDGR